jgi:hypothetical protein
VSRLSRHHHPDVAGHHQRDLGRAIGQPLKQKEKEANSIVCNTVVLLALHHQAKDIVFRFIIEYSSLRDFYGPLGNNNRSIFKGGFLKDVLKLEISCYRLLIS